jgi:hypothetical protein
MTATYTHPAAGYFFMAGVLVGLCCGLRLYVRLLKWWVATLRPKLASWDPLTPFILRMELRNTFWLEIIGVITGLSTIITALQFLR